MGFIYVFIHTYFQIIICQFITQKLYSFPSNYSN